MSLTPRYHVVERSFGTMSRSIRLPELADTANAKAGYDAGVLTIKFPKREAPVSRRLQIPVSGSGSGEEQKEGEKQ